MTTAPENQEKEETTATDQKNNEELAKEIPTVTPDEDNLEPIPNKDQEDQ
ncbi:MAG: hypothetical protein ACRYFB_09350 [Janthinobacterium lividum]